MTAATFELVHEEVRARGPLRVAFKGRAETVEVYEIFGWNDDAAQDVAVAAAFALSKE